MLVEKIIQNSRNKKNFPIDNLYLLASSRSKGKKN